MMGLCMRGILRQLLIPQCHISTRDDTCDYDGRILVNIKRKVNSSGARNLS